MIPPGDRRTGLALLAVQAACYLVLSRPLYAGGFLESAAGVLAVLLLPGFAAVRLGPAALRAHALPLALPAGVVVAGLTAAVGAAAPWPARPLGALHLFAGFLLALLVLLRGRGGDLRLPGGRGAVLLCGLAAIAAGVAGAPVSPYTDGPDHVATVREIALTGDPFPDEALLADGEVGRPDPRKGTFHLALALAAVLSGREAHETWRFAPVALAPAWLLLVTWLGLRLGLGRRTALLAAAIAAVFAGGLGLPFLTRIGYGAHLAGACVLALWALHLRPEGRGRGERVAAGVLLAAATGVHPLAGGLWALPFPGLLLSGSSAERRRLAGDFATAVLCAAPVLAWRWIEASGPVNPLHAQPMPVLEIAGGASVLWPPAVLGQLGGVGLMGAVLCLAGPRLLPGRGGRFLASTAAAALACTLVPGLFDAVAAVGSSLPIKMLALVPAPFALAAVFAAGGGRGRGVLRAAVIVGLALALPAAAARFHPDRSRAGRTPAMDRVLESLRAIEGRGVVAADPWLSYLITAETSHYAVAVPNQHGHPLDARGPERLSDLAAVLAPREPLGNSLRRMEPYRAWFLAAPASPVPAEVGFGAARGGDLDRARRRRLETGAGVSPEPGAPGVWRRSGEAGADAEPAGEPATPPAGWSVAPEDGNAGGVRLVRVAAADAAAGEGIPVILTWERTDGDPYWPVEAHLRFRGPGRLGGVKPWRLVRERLLGAPRTGTRARISPFGAAWPPAAWPTGRAVVETLRVGHELPAGTYEVAVRLRERPVHPRASVADLWWENDRWQGKVLGRVSVAASGAGAP